MHGKETGKETKDFVKEKLLKIAIFRVTSSRNAQCVSAFAGLCIDYKNMHGIT